MQLNHETSTILRRVGTLVVALLMFGGAYAAWAAQSADEDPGRLSNARWMGASPVIDLKLEAGPRPSFYVVSAIVRDVVTGEVLSRPRLITLAGETSTIEIGAEKNAQAVGVRIVVVVHPSGLDAEYTSEVLRDGKVERSQSGTLTTQGSTAATSTTGTGPDVFELTFSSSDAGELACAADAFEVIGEPRSASALRTPADGRVHTAFYTDAAPATGSDALIKALSKCQHGRDSNLAWSMRPASLATR